MRQDFPDVPILCCSATATSDTVLKAIKSLRFDREWIVFKSLLPRWNLKLSTEMKPRPPGKTIIQSAVCARVLQILDENDCKHSSFIVYVMKKRGGFLSVWVLESELCCQQRAKSMRSSSLRVASNVAFIMATPPRRIRCVEPHH